jgi:hypothetical protein
VAQWLDAVARQVPGAERFWLLPTLAWISASDPALHLMCGSGVVFALLLIVGIAPVLSLIALWVLYLSLTCAGQTFLNFQWESLLLETGVLAIFFAPWQLLPRCTRQCRPTRIPLWLVRWLAFRIMFLSGLVKLTFNDVVWWNWSALDYHYFTQPIPTWTSWWMHLAPRWFQLMSLAFMWYAELVAPFFIFGPRRLRNIAFWSIVLLQLLILATGNYGFFNILTITLCIPIVDDQFWPKWLRRLVASPPCPWPLMRWRHWPVAVIDWPRGLRDLNDRISPLRSANGYGLFRVMTTQRREIILEGSVDGTTWKPYEFKWKPGDVTRRPAFCTPHMPRLDWQMWFAALGDYRQNPWLINFMARLLEGSPPVLGLIETDPFPDHPPRYIRAVLYEYHFTDLDERRQTGQWWKRELLGLYCPVLQRRIE